MLQAPKSNVSSTPRVQVSPGTHIARCIGLVQVGTVPTVWEGVEKQTEKVRLTFEFPQETYAFKEGEAEKPFVVSEEYTHSMGSKANLRPVVEGIIGTTLTDAEAENFDLLDLVGRACLVTVVHKLSKKNGQKYANIASAAPLMKGMVAPEQVNPSRVLTYKTWNQEMFDSLPEFIRTKMMTSAQYKKMTGGDKIAYPQDEWGDAIPF